MQEPFDSDGSSLFEKRPSQDVDLDSMSAPELMHLAERVNTALGERSEVPIQIRATSGQLAFWIRQVLGVTWTLPPSASSN